MYSLRAYGDMIGDVGRFDAYAKAIAKAVRPGDVVAEIGCGPGVFSFLACKGGARKVYAIDSADIVHFAAELAAANGLSEKITFIQSDSRKVELPERVNVIVSDIRGNLPLFDHAIAAIEDARERFLAPGGVLIPQRDTLKLAAVDADEYYSGLTSPWSRRGQGLELASTLALVLNEQYGVRFQSGQLLTEPQTWGVLDYTASAGKQVAAKLNFRVLRPGIAHGLCAWFETQLFDDCRYSSGPGGASKIYGQVFLPWLEAVQVVEGQEIQVELHADLVGGDYIWRWETKINSGDGPPRHFKQSTFQGANFAPHSLHRRAADFVPVLSEAGEAERWILQAMDGKTSLQEIAQEAAKRFPRHFTGSEEAFQRVTELSGKYSR
jgi:protein arginine N-methyltransferase 1